MKTYIAINTAIVRASLVTVLSIACGTAFVSLTFSAYVIQTLDEALQTFQWMAWFVFVLCIREGLREMYVVRRSEGRGGHFGLMCITMLTSLSSLWFMVPKLWVWFVILFVTTLFMYQHLVVVSRAGRESLMKDHPKG